MKNIAKYLLTVCIATCLLSCKYKHQEYPISPNVSFENSGGLTYVNLVSIYPQQLTEVTIQRSLGLSKEIEMEVSLDVEILKSYNDLFETQFEVMPQKYFTLPDQITFNSFDKTTPVEITFTPVDYISEIGWSDSKKYVIPLRVKSMNVDVGGQKSSFELLVGVNVNPPTITVANDLQFKKGFIGGVAMPQSVVLKAQTNFTTLKSSKLSYQIYPEGVKAYNDKNQTAYVLLPATDYQIGEITFDAEALTLSTPVTLRAWDLDINKIYILPIKLTSTDYSVVQNADIYVIVEIGEMKISIDKILYNYPINRKSLKETVTVKLNSPIIDDMVIDFTYDPADITTYNTANSTNYKALDPSLFTLPSGAITGGSLKTDLSLVVDLSKVPYNEVANLSDKYAIIISIDKAKTLMGTTFVNNSIFIEFEKTMHGYYDITGHNNYFSGICGPTSIDAGATPEIRAEYPYMNKFYLWAHGFQWKVIWDQPWNGNENWRRVIPWSTATDDLTPQQQIDWIFDNKSYFDMETGEVYQSYKYFYDAGNKDADKSESNDCRMINQRYSY